VEEALRLDDGKVPIAEVCRRLGAYAAANGLTQPSYECVRELVHAVRSVRTERRAARSRAAWREPMARSAYWTATDAVLAALSGRR
jgi:hypothetical protein